MKVYIITEGGKGIGCGHLNRCGSIYRSFEEKKIKPVLLVNGDSGVRNVLKGKCYLVFDWLKNRDKAFRLMDKPDAVLIDSYLADPDFYRQVSCRAGSAAYIDDFNRLDYPRGIVINGSVGAEKINYVRHRDSLYLLGADYIVIGSEFRNTGAHKRVRKEIKTIMLTFGGYDPRGLTPKILALLAREYPDCVKKVIIGRGYKCIKDITYAKDAKTELIYHPDAKGMKRVMRDSDIAISAGGQTLFELAAIGVPTVAVKAAENQTINLKGLKRAGFLKYSGSYDDKKLLLNICRHIKSLTYKNRIKAVAAGRKIIDGKGSNRIVDAIVKNTLPRISIRKADPGDCVDIWKWRNHKGVRDVSFNRERIVFKTHRRWFMERLSDVDTFFYIGICSKKEKIGQVRFQLENERREAYINTNLNPSYFGRGLGSVMIREATNKFMSENPEIRTVMAEILDGNSASKKAFMKAGYSYWRNTVKGGRDAVVFKFNRRKGA